MYHFSGNRVHKLDDKGRVVIPTRYVDAIRQHGRGTLYIVPSQEGSFLEAYPADVWDGMADEQMPSRFKTGQGGKRSFFHLTEEAEITGPGRVTLPEKFLRYFPTGEVRICGMNTYLELWDPALWEQQVGEDGRGPAAGGVPAAPTA